MSERIKIEITMDDAGIISTKSYATEEVNPNITAVLIVSMLEVSKANHLSKFTHLPNKDAAKP